MNFKRKIEQIINLEATKLSELVFSVKVIKYHTMGSVCKILLTTSGFRFPYFAAASNIMLNSFYNKISGWNESAGNYIYAFLNCKLLVNLFFKIWQLFMTCFVFSTDLFLHRQSTSKVDISISSLRESLRFLSLAYSIPSFSSAKLSISLPGTLRANSIRRESDNTDFCCDKTSSCSHKVLINNTMHTPVPYLLAHCIAGLKCLIWVFPR